MRDVRDRAFSTIISGTDDTPFAHHLLYRYAQFVSVGKGFTAMLESGLAVGHMPAFLLAAQ